MAGDPKLSQMQPRKIGGWDPRHVRHLNTQSAALTRLSKPKSLLIRATLLPALLVPLWYQPVLGWFWAIALSLAAVAWVWVIPPIGKKTIGAQTWLQKAMLGERMWLNRMFVPVPAPYHKKALALLVIGLSLLAQPFGQQAQTTSHSCSQVAASPTSPSSPHCL